MRAAARTVGVKTALPDSATTTSTGVSRSRCGTAVDPILKERLFGLTNAQGNHGEDVKELYFYVDGTPTHSYMRMLYKYPHAAFPYEDLVAENGRRGADMPEYEVLDTGVFEDNAYFDVHVEYAKNTPEDIVMRVTVENRGDRAASLDLLPQIWARNTWSWQPSKKPSLTLQVGCEGQPRDRSKRRP
jgi:hypothetical protein